MAGLPLPSFYVRENATRWAYAPDQARLLVEASAYRKAHRLTPSGEDARRIHLLLIDAQKDFCFPEGSLYVGGRSGQGAMEDSQRLAEFIYRNLDTLTEITTTLDSHLPFQIFFASFWVDREGNALSPHREISAAEVRNGDVRPDPALAGVLARGDGAWLARQALDYCERLEKTGKYKLYLWPPHCVLGSDGHAMVGVLHEARLFHAFARRAQSRVEIKGEHPLTENYSVMSPEVTVSFDGAPMGQRNQSLLDRLLKEDVLLIAGEAASHCVKSSVEDLLEEILRRDAALAKKVYLLTDCMSSVTVPDGKGGFLADFTPQAESALRRFEEAGMHRVKSTEPMESWLEP